MVSDEELGELRAKYEEIFGEGAPMMMPADREETARLLRQMIETRDNSLLDTLLPDDAVS